jgi:hypothetical protein
VPACPLICSDIKLIEVDYFLLLTVTSTSHRLSPLSPLPSISSLLPSSSSLLPSIGPTLNLSNEPHNGDGNDSSEMQEQGQEQGQGLGQTEAKTEEGDVCQDRDRDGESSAVSALVR